MPKRMVDGEALWGSDKLAQVQPPQYRAEYANLLPLALANGSFECNPGNIWRMVYAYNREDITRADVVKILDALEAAKLLFRWTVDGKPWGYWVGIGSRLPKGTEYAHAKKGEEPPEAELIAFAGVNDRAATSQRPQTDRIGLGLGKGVGTGLGVGMGSGSGSGLGKGEEPTSTSSNPNSQRDELVNSSTPNPATPKPNSNPNHLQEVVEAMIQRYPRTCRPGLERDWARTFTKGITGLADELFEGNTNLAIVLVNKKLDAFIKKSADSPNVYAPEKFFSEWMARDFDVKKLREKAKQMEDLDD